MLSEIAHPALDADGRQVGEGNVFPKTLRLDLDTEWRVCQYSGSRYRDEMPMNVTALKAMIKYWKPMMLTLGEVCAELRARLGLPVGRWTIGELHTMSCVVLALPAYLLMILLPDSTHRCFLLDGLHACWVIFVPVRLLPTYRYLPDLSFLIAYVLLVACFSVHFCVLSRLQAARIRVAPFLVLPFIERHRSAPLGVQTF